MSYSPFREGYFPINKTGSPLSGDELYKQYREQYEKWPKEQKLGDFPTHLDLELSSACNLHCPMCHTVYIGDPSFKKYKEQRMKDALMDFSVYRKAINEAVNYEHFFSIKLNYRGESTLHPDIVEMIQYAKNKGVYDIMLNSNGNHDFDLIEKMVDAGLTWLSISLDAINPETYKKIRAGGDFFIAYANAISMCRFSGKLNLQVSFVHQKKNDAEKDEFIKFWNKMPINKITIGDFYNPAEFITNISAFEVKQYHKMQKFTCPQLWQRILIMCDGKIFPCCHAFDEPDDLYLGRFPETSIKEAWDSEKLKKIREIHISGDYSEIKTCSTCAYPKTSKDE
jgi:MoaA/NifB/PqqE/SkfB family radical SAM enzyme